MGVKGWELSERRAVVYLHTGVPSWWLSVASVKVRASITGE